MIQHNRPTIHLEEEAAARRVLRSGWLAQGSEVEKFENKFCDFMGLPHRHAVAVSSGTAALFISLWALGAAGKKVALPAYSCSALSNAVTMVGGETRIIDSSSDSPNIDIHLLNESDADIAVVPHIFGLPVDVKHVKKSLLIEDCAHALGARIDDMPVGLHGDIGIFSFYATKLMTSGGQGGMIVAKDKSLIDIVRDYRDFDQKNDHIPRFNFQMTDLQAAIGRVQLKKVPTFLAKREEIFQRYRQAGLTLLDANCHHPVRYRAVMVSSHGEEVIAALERVNIRAIVPVEDWELLSKPEYNPQACLWTHKTVSLPIYPSLEMNDVEKIIREVKLI
ncbi:MAG: DegT/DnrJ/EryC1/StrS family aminotransferase [Negativicutes bacterium]|nr:DegT/DnrJ/EryC1/StrS family aminotransferase [Negativicutes bacterium]